MRQAGGKLVRRIRERKRGQRGPRVAAWRLWTRATAWILVAGALILAAHSFPLWLLVARIQAWILELGVWGPVGFVFVYIAMAALLLPVWPLCVLAASVYGLLLGTALATVGSTTAAAVQFLAARHLARDAIARRIAQRPQWMAVHEAISEGGWRIVALLRLSPLLPFGLQNYCYGLTAIRFWPYVLASFLALLPIDFFYVYIGYMGTESLRLSSDTAQRVHWSVWTVELLGLLLTLGVTVYIIRRARRSVRVLEVARRFAQAPPAADGETKPAPTRRPVQRPAWKDVAFAAVALALFLAAMGNYLSGDWLRTYLEGHLQVADVQ